MELYNEIRAMMRKLNEPITLKEAMQEARDMKEYRARKAKEEALSRQNPR
jgi:hypothetical protein